MQPNKFSILILTPLSPTVKLGSAGESEYFKTRNIVFPKYSMPFLSHPSQQFEATPNKSDLIAIEK